MTYCISIFFTQFGKLHTYTYDMKIEGGWCSYTFSVVAMSYLVILLVLCALFISFNGVNAKLSFYSVAQRRLPVVSSAHLLRSNSIEKYLLRGGKVIKKGKKVCRFNVLDLTYC